MINSQSSNSSRRAHRRRRRVLFHASLALAGTLGTAGHASAINDVWTQGAGTFLWGNPNNWSAKAIPGATDVADLFLANGVSIYNISSNAPVTSAVQVAGGATLEFTAAQSSGDTLETGALEVGGTNTGQPGRNSSAGSGVVSQLASSYVFIDQNGILAVDSSSAYLQGAGQIISSSNEVLAGSFQQSGGINQINAGLSLTNSGVYNLTNTSNSTINCDTIVNSGTFNLSGGLVQGVSTPGSAGNFNFSNSGTVVYTLGNFYGNMNNSGSVQVNSTLFPFNKGFVNNGLLTINGSTGTFAGSILGNNPSASLVVKGSTNLTLTGSSNFSGTTTVTSGSLILNGPVGTAGNNFGGCLQSNVSIGNNGTLADSAADQIPNTATVTINGGNFNLSGFDESIATLVMNAGSILQPSGPGLGVATGNVTVGKGSATINGGLRSSLPFNFNVATGGAVTVNGAIGSYNAAAGQSLTLTGGGTLYFSGNSRLSTITINSGIMQVTEGGSLGGLNTSLTVNTGGSLNLNNQSLTIGDLLGNSNGTVALGTGALTVVSTGTTFPGNITGSGSFIKAGTGTLTLTGVDYATGITTVGSGTLTIASAASIASASIATQAAATFNLYGSLTGTPAITANGIVNIEPGSGIGISTRTVGAITIGSSTSAGSGQVNVLPASTHTNRSLVIAAGLSLSNSSGSYLGQLDLANNDLIIHNTIATSIISLAQSGYSGGSWTGSGLASSVAAADTSHLTALGVIPNDLGGGTPLYGFAGPLGPFDGYYPIATDTLVKFTYYGDANLDGQVDGSDYSRIDNGYLNQITGSTGWYNGDFNYDGVINGSDYTLIDNAFNSQGQNLSTSAQIALATAQIAGTSSAVPEPGAGGVLAIAVLNISRRRRRQVTSA